MAETSCLHTPCWLAGSLPDCQPLGPDAATLNGVCVCPQPLLGHCHQGSPRSPGRGGGGGCVYSAEDEPAWQVCLRVPKHTECSPPREQLQGRRSPRGALTSAPSDTSPSGRQGRLGRGCSHPPLIETGACGPEGAKLRATDQDSPCNLPGKLTPLHPCPRPPLWSLGNVLMK